MLCIIFVKPVESYGQFIVSLKSIFFPWTIFLCHIKLQFQISSFSVESFFPNVQTSSFLLNDLPQNFMRSSASHINHRLQLFSAKPFFKYKLCVTHSFKTCRSVEWFAKQNLDFHRLEVTGHEKSNFTHGSQYYQETHL